MIAQDQYRLRPYPAGHQPLQLAGQPLPGAPESRLATPGTVSRPGGGWR
jgi:hypothetical protein